MNFTKYAVTALLLTCCLAALTTPAQCKIVYVSAAGKDTNDGLTWETAKPTVTAGLGQAVSGDEVWVAKGVYAERINVQSGLGLYGGFAGTETTRDQRDFKTNRTVLDGNKGGTVVTMTSKSTSRSVIDGFVIRNGSAQSIQSGGGIHCRSGYVTVSNNLITNNSAEYDGGGGIYCGGTANRIVNNTIQFNTATTTAAGVYCCGYYSPASVVSDNVISGNHSAMGAGLYCVESVIVTNNTIAGNGVYGVLGRAEWAPATLSNNIIAFNLVGVGMIDGQPGMRNNCLYNPDGVNYECVTAGVGDILTDPKLAGWQYGDFHIQPGSPCRNAGWNQAPEIGSTDADGQARVQPNDGRVDIGADESDGSACAITPVTRVSCDGDDNNNGSSWDLAMKTVQAGIDAAALVGGEVWVAKGTYNERIKLKANVHVYGGFAGTETTRDARDYKANEAVLDGGAGGSVVTALMLGYAMTAVDGFTIRNGSGGGIRCSNSSLVIANNKIVNNTTGGAGAGVCCSGSWPVIRGNRMAGNTARDFGGAIYCSNSPAAICNNVIVNNLAANGSAVCNNSSLSIIHNNIMSANSSSASDGAAMMYSGSCAPFIVNNTITGGNGFGICCSASVPSTISNNIVAFNRGVASDYDPRYLPTLKNNCFYGFSCDMPGVGNIQADPGLAGWQCGDFHIQPDSPCRDTGSNDALGVGGNDIDGQARIQPSNGTVDIGADEWWAGVVDAKKTADGSGVGLSGLFVTAAFPDFFYMESGDRSGGIRVDKIGHGLAVGNRADVEGTLSTNGDGERVIAAGLVSSSGNGKVAPVAVTNRALGGGQFGLQGAVWSVCRSNKSQAAVWVEGHGLSNIGLLVKTWGRVTYSGDGFFYIDDGSGLDDDSGHRGVKVYGGVPVSEGVEPVGRMVTVVGVSSCEKPGDDPVRVVRTRVVGDIRVIGD